MNPILSQYHRERQRRNTEKWMAKPGVKEAQNEKARIRSARNREKARAAATAAATITATANGQSSPDDSDESEPLDFPSSSDERAEPDTSSSHNSNIIDNIRAARIDLANWSWSLGAESLWEQQFTRDMNGAQEDGQLAEFLEEVQIHTEQGRQILRNLKFLGRVSPKSTPDDVADIFLQSYDLIVGTLSEVRFYEIKLAEMEFDG
ncbi:hypothetical protein HWV62_8755 [Athelia sp. TMB]|nr:hypothetical protein HWV62_8755 [Athelia sp. TMB]